MNLKGLLTSAQEALPSVVPKAGKVGSDINRFLLDIGLHSSVPLTDAEIRQGSIEGRVVV